MSFALPPPSLLLNSHRAAASQAASSLTLPYLDSEDDDDDFTFLEDLYANGRKRQLPPHLPLSNAAPAKNPSLAPPPTSPGSYQGPSIKLPPQQITMKSQLKGKRMPTTRGRRGSIAFDGTAPVQMSLSELRAGTWEERAYEIVRRKKMREALAAASQPMSIDLHSGLSEQKEKITGTDRCGLAEERKCKPMVDYLCSLGVTEDQLQKITMRHKACLHVNVDKAKGRLDYLTSVGVKVKDLRKVVVRHPQVLEYNVEGMMKPRVEYLQMIGVPEAKLGRVLTAAPSLLECRLDGCVKARVRFLIEEMGINSANMWKVVVLSPQILTQSIEASLRPRLNYLIKELGVPHEKVSKMITKHPQLLHYSISNGIEPRVEFLRDIGMSDSDIVKVLSRSIQILSLSVEQSLKPKFDYLTSELKCGVPAVISFPAFFTLSLERRIQPRYEFLKSLNRLPRGAFPLNVLAVTDHAFCDRWAKVSVDEYIAFRQKMLLSSFVKKFERRNRLQFECK